MNSRRLLLLGLAFGPLASAWAQPVDPTMLSGLQWRNIGPLRAGRVSAVTGAIGQPGTYYMGLPMGGVWKTTSAGTVWTPIFDDIKTAASVGAVQVAPSDPNVVYVGMGDTIVSGGICEGDGLYKSTDAGKTWQHMGLEFSKQIPSILVDPRDSNTLLVAVKGNRSQKTDQRGVYRSTDGGKTWTKTLFVDDTIGGERLASAYDRPDVVLAATQKNYVDFAGGGSGGGPGGNPGGTHLFKSTDGGKTWTEISENGLPKLAGRVGIAIAQGTDAQRMFISGNFGLYRSDDGGATWRQMAKNDDRIRNGQGGYNCGVYVNTKDPNTVYVVNTCTYVSRDGGDTWTGWKGAPGGDDPQQMWLDPTDGNRIFLGMDQGATITLDGGANWSLWYNQPSAQLYHISADNRFPYWVYGTEQDSGTVGTASRGNLGAITMMDWTTHPGFEFGYVVADPLNPMITYAGGPGLGIVKCDGVTGQSVGVSPSIDRSLKLRQVLNQPLVFNPNNPKELFAAFDRIMSTTDGGLHWKAISPDLATMPEAPKPAAKEATEDKKKVGGNVAEYEDDPSMDDEEREAQRRGGGGAIESMSVSTVNPSVIWAGTSNGIVQVTTNRGKNWQMVNIADLPNPGRADVSTIESSHHDAGTAYAAIDLHGVGDYKPYFYRTHDFGKTWTKITNGLPDNLVSGSFARVIRADTQRAGLLFAGTESSVYVSFDDGDHWQALTNNLPNTSYRDMFVKGNDLVAGTYGRGIWVLDDISPLREITPATTGEAFHLYKPGDAIRVRRNTNGDTPFPPEVPHLLNPPDGAILYYSLAAKPAGDIAIEVFDSAGNRIRRMTSAPMPPLEDILHPIPDFWKGLPKPLPAEVGLNRATWDLRWDSPNAFEHSFEMNANPGLTPPSPLGPLVLPGTYTVRMTVDGKTSEQKVTVKMDPRSPATPADLKAQNDMLVRAYQTAQDCYAGFGQVDAMRTQVATLLAAKPPKEAEDALKAFNDKLDELGGNGKANRMVVGMGGVSSSTNPTFAAANRNMIEVLKTLDPGDMAPVEPMRNAVRIALEGVNNTEWAWKKLNEKDLVDLNAVLTKNGLSPIAPAAGVGHPTEPPKPKKGAKRP